MAKQVKGQDKMRKERLMKIKQSISDRKLMYSQSHGMLSSELLTKFSATQIDIVCDVLLMLEKKISDNSPFVTLSNNEVAQKSTGRIAEFTESGEIREESVEEILSGAARGIYQKHFNVNEI